MPLTIKTGAMKVKDPLTDQYVDVDMSLGDDYAHTDSPSFTGTPTAPTPESSDDSTRLATTEFVQDHVDDLEAADSAIQDSITAETTARQNLESNKAVRYDVDQSLTTAQKIKVYSNIFGASNTAGFHNSIYRGKDITSYLTDGSLWNRINGTGGYSLFEDLFLGDYITKTASGGASNTYVIVHFDYYIRTGADPDLTSHHLVMMPKDRLNLTGYMASDATSNGESTLTFKWNLTNTTANGYIGSRIRNVTMPQCDALVKAVFGASHVLTPDVIYPNSFGTDGRASVWAWASNKNFASSYLGKLGCDLLNETQVYGSQVWSYGSDGTVGYEVGIDKTQFAIFAVHPGFANIRASWWLRSVTSSTYAARVDDYGYAAYNGASNARGVRPRFLLS